MKRFGFVIIILIIAALPLNAQTAKVSLRAKTEVTSAQPVTVGDIAAVDAPQNVAKKIMDTVICTGPTPGNQRIVDAEYVKLKLKSLNLGCTVQFIGSNSATIVGKCLRITPKQLEEAALEYIASQAHSNEIEYEAAIQRSPREIVLAGGSNVEIRVKSTDRGIRPGTNSISLEVLSDDKVVATTNLAVQIKAVANVLVATGVIAQGQEINEQNTKWEKRDLANIANPISMGQENREWVAKRSIRSGAILTTSDVDLPAAIKAGDSIALIVKCGGVIIRTNAQAKQSGQIGDSIRVRSGASREDVRARIVNATTAEIIK